MYKNCKNCKPFSFLSAYGDKRKPQPITRGYVITNAKRVGKNVKKLIDKELAAAIVKGLSQDNVAIKLEVKYEKSKWRIRFLLQDQETKNVDVIELGLF